MFSVLAHPGYQFFSFSFSFSFFFSSLYFLFLFLSFFFPQETKTPLLIQQPPRKGKNPFNTRTDLLRVMLRITRRPPIAAKWRGVLTDPIWLYRGLMRQARALYDDVAREYFRQYIRRTFISHKFVEENSRLVAYIREARQGILALARANAGYIGPLTKVLDSAYGRIGKRRHELLEVGLLLGAVSLAVAVAVAVAVVVDGATAAATATATTSTPAAAATAATATTTATAAAAD